MAYSQGLLVSYVAGQGPTLLPNPPAGYPGTATRQSYKSYNSYNKRHKCNTYNTDSSQYRHQLQLAAC